LKGFLLAEFLLRGDVSSIKKELIAAHLTLTDGESTRVWAVYEQYSEEMSKVNGAKTAILREYSQEYDTLTDDQADDLVRRWLETDVEQAKLRQQFAKIFRKVLPGRKAATFLQLERRISMMMDVQLTSGLPLAQNEV
jgi:Spy/CpxP family protein refolding chaperone